MEIIKDDNYYRQLDDKLKEDAIKRRQLYNPPVNTDFIDAHSIEEDVIIENLLKDNKSICNNKYTEIFKKKEQKINNIRKKYCDGDGLGGYILHKKDIEAYKLWQTAHNDSDLADDKQDTPTPMNYLTNHLEYRRAWDRYNETLKQMPNIMKLSVINSPFHKYMKYMYETYSEVK